MNRFYIYPWKQGSRSARALATALGGKVLKREGSKFVPKSNRKVINWGSSQTPNSYSLLNGANFVNIAGNKLSFFQYVTGPESPGTEMPRFPLWTTSREEAQGWFSQAKPVKAVVARTVLTGHSGAGIIVVEANEENPTPELPQAPLYVEYIPKDAEYRVHIFDGEVIDVQRKVKDPDREVSNWKVRSHQNGFIYTRNNSDGTSHRESCPPDVLEQGKRALASSGLVFGACDIIWNKKRKQAFVLEINTAPGLEGETISVYANAIRSYYGVSQGPGVQAST